MVEDILRGALVVAILLVIAIVYGLPSLIAFYRRHPNRWIITVVNIAFGVPIIGWDIALAGVFCGDPLGKDSSNAGDLGPGLLINADRPVWSGLSEGLNELREQGAITLAEFYFLKAKLLA